MAEQLDDTPALFIVGPAAIIFTYRGFVFKHATNRGVTIGDPMFEPAGVLNRRGAIAHAFTATQLAELWIRVILNANQSDLTPRFDLPANWRYPAAP